MKSILAFSLVGAAFAQMSPLSILGGLNLSPQCLETIEMVATNSSFGNCSYITDLLPLVTMTNASVVPYLDQWMSDICYNQPCSNDSLTTAASMIESGCAADLANSTYITNTTITDAFELYPLIREVLCLKTSDPYTNTSYNSTLGNPAIPITEYNSTGGYFCISSLLTQLSAYFGTNVTVDSVEALVNGSNSTATMLVQGINPNILCNECIFGIVDVIEVQFPSVGNVSVQTIFGGLGVNATMNVSNTTTLNEAMNGECPYVPLAVSMNGTLPENITESAVNSTFMYNITMTNDTNTMSTSAMMTTMTTSLLSATSAMSVASTTTTASSS